MKPVYWEYKSVMLMEKDDIINELNKLGKEGWRLVESIAIPEAKGRFAILTRSKPAQ